jgi:glycosidase
VPWIPLGANAADHNVEAERGDPGSFHAHYRRLIHLRNASAALHRGAFADVSATTGSVYAYFRFTDRESVFVVTNFSAKPKDFTLDLRGTPWDGRTGAVVDLYSGASFAVLSEGNRAAYPVSLPGRGFVLLTIVEER